MNPRKRHKIMSLNFHRKSPAAFYFLLLTSALLTACASSQPRPVASYSSALRSSENEPRQLATMSDEEVGDQRAGTTKKETTAESQTTSKRGKTQKQLRSHRIGRNRHFYRDRNNILPHCRSGCAVKDEVRRKKYEVGE